MKRVILFGWAIRDATMIVAILLREALTLCDIFLLILLP